MRLSLRLLLLLLLLLTLLSLGELVSEKELYSDHEVRLLHLLFHHRGYNRLIRPVINLNRTVRVDFGLAMVQLINVEEKSQVMKSNVWLRMNWYDYQLRWDPADFGGLQVIRVNSKKVWNPDIVLYNNADGKYEVSWQPNVLVFSTGKVMWIPPAIYKSSCTIRVMYFPFDQQECEMKFGSWTFDASQVSLGWYEGVQYVDLNDYWKSGSWDIINCPGSITLIEKPGMPAQTMVNYTVTIRRKTLFYTVNLIIPCVLISFLSVCVFYLPADAGEKMTLCISILLALVVFLLLVSKILPPTSISIPLISKFLLFTFIMNIVTIVVTVVIINWNFRTPRTHKMPVWVRRLFLKWLPRLLLMTRPEHVDQEEQTKQQMTQLASSAACNGRRRQLRKQRSDTSDTCDSEFGLPLPPASQDGEDQQQQQTALQRAFGDVQVTPELRRAIAAINFISAHLRVEDEYRRVLQDWKYVASVIDRVQLVIFSTVTVVGAVAFLMNAPFVLEFVDQDAIIERLAAKAS